MKNFIFLTTTLFVGQTNLTYCQTAENNSTNLPYISKAPVSYRINESGSKLHGYYKKDYNLTIYGDSSIVGFRADCDKDDDWSGATVGGTTQSSNSFETTFGCVFNPHNLFGTVLPGNNSGQNHFDKLRSQSVGIGDLTLTYKLDKNNNVIDSIVGVVFDRGPHNQPGESSVATCKKFKTQLDNNQFIYFVFPNTAKYLIQIIGTKSNSQKLKRNPTNSDFEETYKLMMNEIEINKRKQMQNDLLNLLSQIPIISNFDNATPQEKAEGKLRPKNNDRNLNE
jgi:hypothetical protein